MSESQRILVVDDDTRLLMSMAIRLRGAGYDVMTATDGYQALSQAVSRRPDLIILDVNMPVSDGFEVRQRLMNMGQDAAPVIYVTGENSDWATFTGHRLGARAVLFKPVHHETLLAAVRESLHAA
jgi:DNA-binding response OmpR family regulator